MGKKTITLSTLRKIEGVFKRESRPVSINYIYRKYTIHTWSIKHAIKELLKNNFIEEINSSSCKLYQIKNGK